MKLEEQVLSIQQMKELEELKIPANPKPNFYWVKSISNENEVKVMTSSEVKLHSSGWEIIWYTLTLHEVLDILPPEVLKDHGFWLLKDTNGYKLSVKNNPESALFGTFYYDTPLDAAFRILKWWWENHGTTVQPENVSFPTSITDLPKASVLHVLVPYYINSKENTPTERTLDLVVDKPVAVASTLYIKYKDELYKLVVTGSTPKQARDGQDLTTLINCRLTLDNPINYVPYEVLKQLSTIYYK